MSRSRIVERKEEHVVFDDEAKRCIFVICLSAFTIGTAFADGTFVAGLLAGASFVIWTVLMVITISDTETRIYKVVIHGGGD